MLEAERTESAYDKEEMPAEGSRGRVSGKLRQKLMGVRPADKNGVFSTIEIVFVRSMTSWSVVALDAALSMQVRGNSL